MNIERLHRILLDLTEDLEEEKLIRNLQAVRDNLQNQVNQPSQPAYQTNLVDSLKKLYNSLETSDYNSYSPGWKKIISEISKNLNFGQELEAEIKNIFSSNTITPANALEEIKDIFDKTQAFLAGAETTLKGFESLEIDDEELLEGECELGYTIPRYYVENKLSELRKEIGELNFILNNISEAVNGKKEEFIVKTISSSDFLLYILVGLKVAEVLANATEKILAQYKQILEIKSLRNQLSEKGIPASKTRSIETHANNLMESEIKTIAKQVIDENYKGDAGRKNELENGLVIALNKLANRIDKGFQIEIRVKEIEENKENPEENEQKVELINSIQESSHNIEFFETKGKSILELPEK